MEALGSETDTMPPEVIHEVKDTMIATVFNLGFFLGLTGLHSFYLDKWTKGTIQLLMGPLVQLCWLLFISLVTFSIGFYIFAPISVISIIISMTWQLVDLWNIDRLVYRYNRKYFTAAQQRTTAATNVNPADANKPVESYYFHPVQKELPEMSYPGEQQEVTNP